MESLFKEELGHQTLKVLENQQCSTPQHMAEFLGL